MEGLCVDARHHAGAHANTSVSCAHTTEPSQHKAVCVSRAAVWRVRGPGTRPAWAPGVSLGPLLPSALRPSVSLVHPTSHGNRGTGSKDVRKVRGHGRLPSQEGGDGRRSGKGPLLRDP